MAQEFKLPDLGEGITGGDVVQVLVKEGDTIRADQPVIEIETDKAVLEVPCTLAGKIAKVHVKQGERIKVGSPLVSVETSGAGAAASEPAPSEAPAKQAQKEEAKRDTDASPATEAAPSSADDKGKKAAGGKKAAAAKPAAKAAEPAPAEEEKPPKALSAAPAAPSAAAVRAAGEDDVPAGPATRRLARELGVDLRSVASRFPGERLTEEHIKAFVRGDSGAAPVQGGPAIAEPPLPDFSQWGETERVALSALGRKSAEHLHMSWVSAPHVTQFDAADVTALESLRKRHRQRHKGVKLTVTAFVLKAVTAALKEMPIFNASYDARTQEIVLKKFYHIGVAVDTEAGLIVPVIRDVDQKRVLDLATELDELADRTRRRKLKPEEMKGGTFTITNLGGIGGTGFTPIINHPEVAILGLARSREELFLADGEVSSRLMLPLCLSYDHRVINGADGARFTRKVAELLEDPELLLLE